MDIVSPPPNISLKTHPVHKLVQETYIEQASIGWNHVMRGRVSQKWLEAQTLHNISRKSKNRAQGHVVIWIIWTAIEHLGDNFTGGRDILRGSLHTQDLANFPLREGLKLISPERESALYLK